MIKKRWLQYAIFGLVFYLIFLVIELPASWFAWGLNRYTQGSLRLDPISGTLWSGRGRLILNYPKTVPHDFGEAQWRINPLWLFTGRIQLSLETSSQDRQIRTTFGITANRFLLKNTEALVPFIAQLYPPASLISPQGKVRLTASELDVEPEKMGGTAVLEWQSAGSSLSNVQPLGDYRLEITGAGKTASLKLTTLRGVLELTGQGQWLLASGQLQLTGSARPRERAIELEPLLKLLGKEQGDGKRIFATHGQFMPPGLAGF